MENYYFETFDPECPSAECGCPSCKVEYADVPPAPRLTSSELLAELAEVLR